MSVSVFVRVDVARRNAAGGWLSPCLSGVCVGNMLIQPALSPEWAIQLTVAPVRSSIFMPPTDRSRLLEISAVSSDYRTVVRLQSGCWQWVMCGGGQCRDGCVKRTRSRREFHWDRGDRQGGYAVPRSIGPTAIKITDGTEVRR